MSLRDEELIYFDISLSKFAVPTLQWSVVALSHTPLKYMYLLIPHLQSLHCVVDTNCLISVCDRALLVVFALHNDLLAGSIQQGLTGHISPVQSCSRDVQLSVNDLLCLHYTVIVKATCAEV